MEPPTLISQGVRVDGTVRGQGAVHIDGAVSGTLSVAGEVRVGRGAAVTAALEADDVFVQGAVHGPVVARRSITLADGAVAEGDLSAPQLGVAPTARVRGQLTMQIKPPRTARPGRRRG